MSQSPTENKKPEEYKTPKPIKLMQDYLGPFNTLYLLPGPIAIMLDILTPFGPLLLIFAIITGLLLAYNILAKFLGKSGLLKTTPAIIGCLIAFLIFSASASANLINHNTHGNLANWIPKIKVWQDAYLVSIKKDTEEINKKVDKTNLMLSQLLDGMRPQLEKPLVEEIPSYSKLPQHQKDALLLFTKKVGTNGIKKYKALLKDVQIFAEEQTPEKAKLVVEHFDYIVRVQGKDIKDTKSKSLISALFLDTETYEYLMGDGNIPSNLDFLKYLGIDTNKPLITQLLDPLGDYIKQLELQNGVPPEQKVVIPTNERIVEGNLPKVEPEKTQDKPVHNKSKHSTGSYRYM